MRNKVHFWIGPPFCIKNTRRAGWREIIMRTTHYKAKRTSTSPATSSVQMPCFPASLTLQYSLTKTLISCVSSQTHRGSGLSCVLSAQLWKDWSCESPFHIVYSVPKYSLSNLRKSSSVNTVPSGFFFAFFSGGRSLDFLPLFWVRTCWVTALSATHRPLVMYCRFSLK